MWALTGLEGGRLGNPAGWRSSGGAAAPSRYRGGRGRNRSWPNLLAGPEPRGWRRPLCGMGSARARRSGCGGTGQRRRTEMEVALLAVQTLYVCFPPAAVWCRCNICCTSSRLYGGSSLLWCTLSWDWNWGQKTCYRLQWHLVILKTQLTDLQSSKLCAVFIPTTTKCSLTRQLLLDERQHCKVNLAVCNDNLPLESVHGSHPRPLRVHLPTQKNSLMMWQTG